MTEIRPEEISTQEIIEKLKELIRYFEMQRKKIRNHDEKELSDTFIP